MTMHYDGLRQLLNKLINNDRIAGKYLVSF